MRKGFRHQDLRVVAELREIAGQVEALDDNDTDLEYSARLMFYVSDEILENRVIGC